MRNFVCIHMHAWCICMHKIKYVCMHDAYVRTCACILGQLLSDFENTIISFNKDQKTTNVLRPRLLQSEQSFAQTTSEVLHILMRTSTKLNYFWSFESCFHAEAQISQLGILWNTQLALLATEKNVKAEPMGNKSRKHSQCINQESFCQIRIPTFETWTS